MSGLTRSASLRHCEYGFIKLYINYTKRLRDEVGAKFQTVIFNLDSNEKLADYRGQSSP